LLHPQLVTYAGFVREVVDLPDAQLAALDAWRATRGLSRTEAIEQAVQGLIQRSAPDSEREVEYAQVDDAVEREMSMDRAKVDEVPDVVARRVTK
jgi:metal-responsive CopG/Arc/MetJ family transcriptional regulator